MAADDLVGVCAAVVKETAGTVQTIALDVERRRNELAAAKETKAKADAAFVGEQNDSTAKAADRALANLQRAQTVLDAALERHGSAERARCMATEAHARAELDARRAALRERAGLPWFRRQVAELDLELVLIERRLREILAARDEAFCTSLDASDELARLGEHVRHLDAIHLVAAFFVARVNAEPERVGPILNWLPSARVASHRRAARQMLAPVLLSAFDDLFDRNTRAPTTPVDDIPRLRAELAAHFDSPDSLAAAARIRDESYARGDEHEVFRRTRAGEPAPPGVTPRHAAVPPRPVVVPVAKTAANYGGRPVDVDAPDRVIVTRGAGGPNESSEEWEMPRR